jgi:hypothetical protein
MGEMACQLDKLSEELLRTIYEMHSVENVPDDFRVAASETLDDLRQMMFSRNRARLSEVIHFFAYFAMPNLGTIRPPTETEKKKGKAAAARITRRAKRLSDLVKNSPKYKTMEFKCIGDFDKCREQRGPYSAICAFAFMICIGRRMVPFMK